MARKSTSKFASVIRKLPKFVFADKEYQSRVEVTKTIIRNELKTCPYCVEREHDDAPCDACKNTRVMAEHLNATNLTRRYAELRAEKERIERAEYDVNLELEALTQMLVDSQEQGAEGWGSFGAAENTLRLVTGDSLRTQPEPYAIVEDKHKFRDWCVKNGKANELELPVKATSDLLKDRLLEGLPEPDGTKVFVKTKLVFTPLKPVVQDAPTNAAADTVDSVF